MFRKHLFTGSFFLLTAFLLYQAGRLLWPSIGALLAAAVLALVFYPVHQAIRRRVRHEDVSAALSDLFVLAFFFVPVGVIVWAAIAQSGNLIPFIRPVAEQINLWTQSAPLQVLDYLSTHVPGLGKQLEDLSVELQKYLDGLTNETVVWFAHLGARVAEAVWQLLLSIVALFFFFRDGESLLKEVRQLIPLRAEIKRKIEDRVHRMVISAVRAAILTSMAQSIAAIIGFIILGVPSAFILGFLTLIVAVIPIVGSALIWVPISIYFFWSGVYWKGIFMLIWGALLIGSIDNFLRPWLIGMKQHISFFWLFFSIVGGLQVFGIFGVLIGPLIIAVLIILLDIYDHVYLHTQSE